MGLVKLLHLQSPRAFYECMQVDSVDVSGSELKYLESNFAIYTDSLSSLKTDNFECDCINDWMASANFVEGYGCEVSEIEGKCPPRAVHDGFQFNFYADSSNTAIVSHLNKLRLISWVSANFSNSSFSQKPFFLSINP